MRRSWVSTPHPHLHRGIDRLDAAYIWVGPIRGIPLTDRKFLKLQRRKSDAAAALERHSSVAVAAATKGE
jgi:hypothetical protein